MADLTFERIHGLQRYGVASDSNPFHGLLRDLRQLRAPLGPITIDIEHEAGSVTGASLHRQTSELLNGFEYFAITTDENGQLLGIPLLRGNHRNGRAAMINVNVDISSEIDDIEKFFKVIGTDLTLFFEALDGVGRGGVLAHDESVLLNVPTVTQLRRFFLFWALRRSAARFRSRARFS